MKAVAIGRLGDVTKLLRTQRRDSQWHMQDFVNSALRPFPRSQQSLRSGGVLRPGNF